MGRCPLRFRTWRRVTKRDEDEEGQERLRALRMLIGWTLRGKQANRSSEARGKAMKSRRLGGRHQELLRALKMGSRRGSKPSKKGAKEGWIAERGAPRKH